MDLSDIFQELLKELKDQSPEAAANVLSVLNAISELEGSDRFLFIAGLLGSMASQLSYPQVMDSIRITHEVVKSIN